ncbi:MAG: PA14 domain-containing protein [Verrucomicrobiota bacterium]
MKNSFVCSVCVSLLAASGPIQAGVPGELSRELWQNIPGESVSDLTGDPKFYGVPDIQNTFAGVEPPSNLGEDYGQRLRGYLTAPLSGDYTFWISGDDNCELWLSTDDGKFGRQRIAHVADPAPGGFNDWTQVRQWDKMPSQQSAPVALVAGQRYYLEVLHKEQAGGDHVSIAWQVPGGVQEVVPASAVDSFIVDANDADDDELPDDWEVANGLDPADDGSTDPDMGPLGDPDGDGIPNITEFQGGTDPQLFVKIGSGDPGLLSREIWWGISGAEEVESLTEDPRFHDGPIDIVDTVAGASAPSNLGDNYGQRLRGYIMVPTAGDYTFWIAGDDNCELWISTDEGKFGRQKIAYVMDPAAGGFNDWTLFHQWDKMSSQQSPALRLVPGQRYYLEIIHKEYLGGDHVAIAWQGPGGVRELVPASALESFVCDANDLDDDELPDDWEVAYGLDPSDAGDGNYFMGALGDPDNDGASNIEEWRLGSHPLIPEKIQEGDPGFLTRQIWLGIPGEGVESLVSNPLYYYADPDVADTIAGSEVSQSQGDNYGQKLLGYLIAPANGDYTFWIAGDDNCELWLSTDDSKFTRQRIAYVADDAQGGVNDFTAPQQWDKMPSQQSEPITLIAGQRYYLEILHKENSGGDHLSVAWQIPGGQQELIPASALESFLCDVNDADFDDLADDWEMAYGLANYDNGSVDENNGPLGDPDGDGIINLIEYQLDTNPLIYGTTPGHLSREVWLNIPGFSVADLTSHPNFRMEPDISELNPGAEGPVNVGDEFGSRYRGFIIAPVTGLYEFWIAGDDQGELWLSAGETKFEKELIAWNYQATGFRVWDQFIGQKSAPIHLDAGEKYYLEAFNKEAFGNDHFSLAWAYQADDLVNWSLDAAAVASQSTTADSATDWAASKAIDGDTGGWYPSNGVTQTDSTTPGNWWQVDLGAERSIKQVVLHNRMDCCSSRLSNFRVSVLDAFGTEVVGEDFYTTDGQVEDSLIWELPETVDGSVVKVALLGLNSEGNSILSLAEVQVLGSSSGADFAVSPRKVIPAQWIESNRPDTNDLDDDDLPDDWELASGLDSNDPGSINPDNGYYGDPDGDTIPNWAEYRNGTDPLSADSPLGLVGALLEEIWTQAPGSYLTDLYNDPRYAHSPTQQGLVFGSEGTRLIETNSGVRLRGYVEAPATGTYRFYLSGDNDLRFWLSTDENKFNRELLIAPAYASAYRDYLWHETQASEEVQLVAGQRYYIEMQAKHADYAVNSPVSLAWQTPGTTGISPVPGSLLSSYVPQPDDVDDDDLPDAWELTHSFDATDNGSLNPENGPTGDPDGDLLSNAEEFLAGTDPRQANSAPGFLTVERNYGMPFYTIDEASQLSDKPFLEAEENRLVVNSTSGRNVVYSDFVGQRMRGYIVAPTTGTYRFWVSSTADSKLLLSTGEDKYHKRVIAAMGPDLGSGLGVNFASFFMWDSFSSQMSEEVELVAGQKYFLEVLHQHGHGNFLHASVAWAPPGEERQFIDRSHLESYVPLAEDADDDSLPDAWETDYGLSVPDNGLTDRDREGENGDFDGDGLINRLEYVHGTDPSLADTDGDGLSDLDEILNYGTDPTSSDALPEQIVSTVPPSSVVGVGDTWVTTGSGVLSSSFRSEGQWNFDVPSDGYWVLLVGGRLRGNLRLDETLPVHMSIDGVQVQRSMMSFRSDNPGSLRLLTPYLKAGTHQLGLFIDNYTARRSLEITSIQVTMPAGPDNGGNGIPDWVDTEITKRSGVFTHAVVSHISPAFIEGVSPSHELVDLTAITRSGQVNREQRFNDQQWSNMLPGFQNRLDSYQVRLQQQMRAGHGRMEGFQVPHLAGPGHQKWFSRIDLRRNEAIGYVAQFENLGTAENGIIVWQPYNVMDGGTMTIPVGSNLLLGVWVQDWDWQTVTLTIDGQSYQFPAAKTHVEHFDTPGTYQLTCSHPGGQTGSMTVVVRDADLPSDLVTAENRYRTVSLPGVASDLALDSGGEIGFSPLSTLASGGSEVTMAGIFPGIHRTAVRITESAPILDQDTVNIVGISDALRNDGDLATPQGDGIFLVRSPLLVTYLPEDASIRVVIFAGGVTFTDGTTEKTLTVDDLDEFGFTTQEFLIPAERLGAPCHYVEILDKDGVRIWDADQ